MTLIQTGPLLKTETQSDLSVPVYKTVQVSPSKTPLQYTGSGFRKKTIFAVKVYFLESYASTKAPLTAPQKVLKMTLFRDLSSEDIKKSFSDRLKANDIDTEADSFKNIFSQIPEKMHKGDTISFIAEKTKTGAEKITFEFPDKTFTETGANLAHSFWKIWFGKTEDDGGLNDLKAELLPNS